MKIDLIIVYQPRYVRGHEFNFVPPITGMHLAALTPPPHVVRIFHQQTSRLQGNTDADLVALSFFSGFADEAYELARRYRTAGRTVVAGGPHPTFWPEETLKHVDTVVIGEAESVWPKLLEDFQNGQLKSTYSGTPLSLSGLPTPRYDLLKERFFVKRVIQATRGCPYSCSFCSVPTLNPGFRKRGVDEVLADIRYDGFAKWWERKIAWFWDDNLTADRVYAKTLFRAMIPLRKWWLTQASVDIAEDTELLDLMAASGCIGVFLGIETFSTASLQDVNKNHNRALGFKKAIHELRKRGICVMSGFIAGFDGDSSDDIVNMADRLHEAGVDVPFLSVLTPYRGTPLYDKLLRENRLIAGKGWPAFNGYNVTFRPQRMTPEQLLAAHRQLWNRAFSLKPSLQRILRSARHLKPGAFLMSAVMNLFYGLKWARSNPPRIQ